MARFTPHLFERVRTNLAAFERREISPGGLRRAAVALTLMADEAGETCFAITRRTANVGSHSGQWAIPGGRLDHGEEPIDAALRELREELGVELPAGAVVGELDDFATRSGYVITPVVAWAEQPVEFQPNPAEVARAYRVPVSALEEPHVPKLWTIPQSDRPILSIAIAMLETTVHSPTAAILFQLREVALHGRPTRVAHYEQPLFAWK